MGKPPLTPQLFVLTRRVFWVRIALLWTCRQESAEFVLSREMDLERLISHRFPLGESIEALQLAAHPKPDSMKIVIQPGSEWKDE